MGDVMKSRILVVSAAEMDMLMLCDRVPSSGDVIRGRAYDYIPGGKGTNAAVTIARLGGDCVFCSCLGDDENGAKLRRHYNECGVDTRFIATDRNAKTGLSVVIGENSGSIRTITYPGASERLTVDHIEEAFTCYPDALYLQTELPHRLVLSAARFAAAQKIPIFMHASSINKEYPLEELERLEILLTDAQNTHRATGIMPTDMENCLKAAMALEARVKAKFYVIRIAGRGVFIYDGRYYQMQTTYEVDKSDTATASDAFGAAFALNYLAVGDIKNACAFANAVGDMTVDHGNEADPIPRLRIVKDLITERKLSIRL